MFGPDLTHRAVAICMDIAIGKNLGKFGGPQLPYQKWQEISGAGRHPIGPLTITFKNQNPSAM